MLNKILCYFFGHKNEGRIFRAIYKFNYFAKNGQDISGLYIQMNRVCSRCQLEKKYDFVPFEILRMSPGIPTLDTYFSNDRGLILHKY